MIITADFETRGLSGDFTVGAWYNGARPHFFWDIEDFLADMAALGRSMPDKTYVNVYFHNLDFDARYIVTGRSKNLNGKSCIFINNKLARLALTDEYEKGLSKVRFNDSYALISTGLAKACRDFGIDTAESKMDIRKLFNRYKVDNKDDFFRVVDPKDPDFLEYLRLDVVSLYTLIGKFRDVIDTVVPESARPMKLNLTMASTALAMYAVREPKLLETIQTQRVKELTKGRKEIGVQWAGTGKYREQRTLYDSPCLDMVRESYRGGRNEVFCRYGESLHSYDVNSLYPSVMKDFKYPIWPEFMPGAGLDEFENCRRLGRPYIVRATVRAPDMEYPVLGVGDFTIDKFVYRVGTFSGCWCSPEFEKAIEKGYEVLEVKDLIYYKAELDFFSKWVDDLYQIRLDNGKYTAQNQTAKLALNSLYGKFGQRDSVKRLKVMSSRDYEQNTSGVRMAASLGNGDMLCELRELAKIKHNYVSLASFITSQARLRLYNFIELVEQQGGRVYYTDTDSIKTDVRLDNHPNRLGWVKHEYDIVEGVFIRPKMYACLVEKWDSVDKCTVVEEEIKNKGVIKDVLDLLSYHDIKKMLFSKQKVPYYLGPEHRGEYRLVNGTYKRIPRTRDIIFNKGTIHDSTALNKTLSTIDDKRVTLPDCIHTRARGDADYASTSQEA